MRSLTTDSNLDYSGPPPVVVIADSEHARAKAEATIAACNYRMARVSMAEAPARMRRQAAASALWLELENDPGDALLPLLTQIGADADDGRYAAVAAINSSLIDRLVGTIGNSAIELVIDGSEAERRAALAGALSGAHKQTRLSDSAADQKSERLRRLSDEVARIASTLARISADSPAATPAPAAAPEPESLPEVSVETVRNILAARRLRSRFLPDDLFADPAWDMLLDLLQAELTQLRVSVSSMCIAAAVPATTALRWMKTMTDRGLFVRRADPYDGRRVYIELAPETSLALRRYFAEIGGNPQVV